MFPHYGPSIVAFMDIPLVRGDEDMPWAPRVAAYQRPWPGSVLFTRFEDDQYLPFDAVSTAAFVGHTLDAVKPSRPWLIDKATKFRVQMYSDEALLSINRDQFLHGGNLLCLESNSGWELVQFMSAELIAKNTYELSVLLRGQHGTEHMMGSKAGARVVVWNEATCTALDIQQDMAGLPIKLRYGPSAHNPTHYTWTDKNIVFKSQGLRPLSPIHIRQKIIGDQFEFKWIRRTRINGDAWEQVDVPLSEDRELYDVHLISSDGLDETVLAKATDLDRPIWTTVFNPDATEVRIWQKSSTVGRGEPGTARIVT